MANENELTGMNLLKTLIARDEKGESMSTEEREWYEAQKKASLKFKAQIESGGYNRDHIFGAME